MRWATSGVTTVLHLAAVPFLEARRPSDVLRPDDPARARLAARRREWLSYWESEPAPLGAKDHVVDSLFAWVFAGVPSAVLVGLAVAAVRALGAPLPSIAAPWAFAVLAAILAAGLLAAVTPRRNPTRADRVVAGWPGEVLVLAAVAALWFG
jgi:hypothetical protein